MSNTWRRNRSVVVGSNSTVDLPVVVAEVVSGSVTLAVHKAIFTSLFGVGAVNALIRSIQNKYVLMLSSVKLTLFKILKLYEKYSQTVLTAKRDGGSRSSF